MPKTRLPAVQQFMSRDGTLGQVDSFVQNGVFNKQGEKTYVIKRPGTAANHDFGTAASTQGAVFYNGLVYAVYGDTLYRNGGAVDVGSTGTTWTQGSTPLWYGRSFFTATVFGSRIYVIGGEASVVRADISYSADGINWSENASAAPFGHRQGHQCVAFNGQLFLMGGFNGVTAGVENDVWSSPDGVNWTQVTAAAQWSARVNFTAVAANNGIYLYGGEDGTNTLLDDVWFSSDGATWTNLTMTATGTPRFLNAMFFFQNKVWIIGGYADTAGTTTINDINTSPDGQTWTTTAPVFPTGKAIMAYTIYAGQMWLIGGDAGGTLVSDVWHSSTLGNAWFFVTPAPGFSARGGAQAVAFPTPPSINSLNYPTMFLYGGNDGVTDLQEQWYANLDLSLPTTFAMSPSTANQPYQFNTFLNGSQLLIKNESNFWVLQAGVMVAVSDVNYPSVTVPGIVVLNEFAYVMQPDGTIRACALGDPLHWPSLQFVIADYEDDAGVAISKYLNYLVAFGTYTLQFFYDAGNPAPGISLSPYQAASAKVGLAFASTLVSINNTLMWVGQTENRNLGVYLFDGLSPKRVSTPWIDKVLNVNLTSSAVAFAASQEGHVLYVLNMQQSGFAVVYDQSTGQWYIWDNSNEGAFPYNAALTEFTSGGDLWFGTGGLAGQMLGASFESYDDDGEAFDLRIQTDKVDADSLQRKFWGQADFVADINPATVTLEVSDDDYQTWNTWGTFDLTRMRPMLNRGGSSRRRAFRATQTDSAPARWEAVEITVSQGES